MSHRTLESVLVLALALVAQAQELDTTASGHNGPAVAQGSTGPARFAGIVYDRFQTKDAMDVIEFVDGFYRAPGNFGYDASLDRMRRDLEAIGFGTRPGFELEEILTPMASPAWTPLSGRITVMADGLEPIVLHAFETPEGVDRVMLPIHAPSADVEGPVVLAEQDSVPGCILVTDKALGNRAIAAYAKQGVAAVLSSSRASFTIDSSGGDEHLDAIQFRTLAPGVLLPTAQISPRSHARLRELLASHGDLRLHLEAKVSSVSGGDLRTLVARVIGAELPGEVVAIVSHVQEPGAGDNASGVGGLCQLAVTYARLLQEQKLKPAARSLAFVWGDEMRQSSIWLEHNKRRVLAGISADMLGQSKDATGAICLLERSPDPGALDTLAPDQHTPWGAGHVSERDLLPSGLSLIARHALVDMAAHVGGWNTSENPWEGGSDHDIFLAHGVPGILLWHFTDFTYHTGLDRMSRLDSEELRRTCGALLATALAVADLRRADLQRYHESNLLERKLRVEAALAAGRPDIAKRWREWCQHVDEWLTTNVVDGTDD